MAVFWFWEPCLASSRFLKNSLPMAGIRVPFSNRRKRKLCLIWKLKSLNDLIQRLALKSYPEDGLWKGPSLGSGGAVASPRILRIAPELLEPSFSWHRYALWSEDYVFKNKLLGRTLSIKFFSTDKLVMILTYLTYSVYTLCTYCICFELHY